MVMVAMDIVLVIMDTVIAVMATMIMAALTGRNNNVAMPTTVTAATVMIVVAMGIVPVVGFAMIHVRWEWPPDHIRTADTGRRETCGADGVLVCGVCHVRGDTAIWEVRQVRDLVSPWHLVRATQGVVYAGGSGLTPVIRLLVPVEGVATTGRDRGSYGDGVDGYTAMAFRGIVLRQWLINATVSMGTCTSGKEVKVIAQEEEEEKKFF